MVLVIGNLVLALADASGTATRLFDSRHNIFWGVSAIAAVVLVCTMTVPFLSEIFRVEAPDSAVIVLSVFVAVIAGGWYGVAKRWTRPGPARPSVAIRSPTPEGREALPSSKQVKS
jgi:Ca2+-transporting ATPase